MSKELLLMLIFGAPLVVCLWALSAALVSVCWGLVRDLRGKVAADE